MSNDANTNNNAGNAGNSSALKRRLRAVVDSLGITPSYVADIAGLPRYSVLRYYENDDTDMLHANAVKLKEALDEIGRSSV